MDLLIKKLICTPYTRKVWSSFQISVCRVKERIYSKFAFLSILSILTNIAFDKKLSKGCAKKHSSEIIDSNAKIYNTDACKVDIYFCNIQYINNYSFIIIFNLKLVAVACHYTDTVCDFIFLIRALIAHVEA